MDYLLFLASQAAVAFKLPSFLCHWRVYYCSNLLLIFTLLSLIIEGQAGFITPRLSWGSAVSAIAGGFGLVNPLSTRAQEAQNSIKLSYLMTGVSQCLLYHPELDNSSQQESSPDLCKPRGSQIKLSCSSGTEHRGLDLGDIY